MSAPIFPYPNATQGVCSAPVLTFPRVPSHSRGRVDVLIPVVAICICSANALYRAGKADSRTASGYHVGTDLFGDKVNLYTGRLEFVQTDVTLPGNSSLPVSVGRRLVTG